MFSSTALLLLYISNHYQKLWEEVKTIKGDESPHGDVSIGFYEAVK